MAEPDSSLPIAFVAHATPCRTRLRIPERRRQPAYFAQLAERLAAHPQVRQVVVNAATGSVLLRHDGAIASIAADLRDTLRIMSHPPGPSMRRSVPRPAKVPPVSALQLAALGCVALAAWQVRRGRLVGAASESLWHAYNAWRHLHAPGIGAALLGGGIVQLARGRILSPAVSLLFYAMNLRETGRQQGAPNPE